MLNEVYVIDIDKEQLLYYIGSQKAPFEGNSYGTEPVMLPGMCEAYYPCMLSAGFSFQYVRAAKSEHVADEMESSKKDKEHIQIYDVKRLKEGRADKNDYYADITRISALLYTLNKKMVSIMEGLSDCHPTSENRIHDLQGAVALTGKAIRELEKQVEIIK